MTPIYLPSSPANLPLYTWTSIFLLSETFFNLQVRRSNNGKKQQVNSVGEKVNFDLLVRKISHHLTSHLNPNRTTSHDQNWSCSYHLAVSCMHAGQPCKPQLNASYSSISNLQFLECLFPTFSSGISRDYHVPSIFDQWAISSPSHFTSPSFKSFYVKLSIYWIGAPQVLTVYYYFYHEAKLKFSSASGK